MERGFEPEAVPTKRRKSATLRSASTADEDGKIRKLYPGERVTYIVDKEGVIRFIQNGVPDNECLLRVLKKLSR